MIYFKACNASALSRELHIIIIQSFDQVVRERSVARTVRGDGDVNVVCVNCDWGRTLENYHTIH